MSDFSDHEDRLLVQFALAFERQGDRVAWDELTQRMRAEGGRRSKYALQQRLKTLKRTHGRQLTQFPRWFFRKALGEPSSMSKSIRNATGMAATRARSEPDGGSQAAMDASGSPPKRRKLSVLCKPKGAFLRATDPVQNLTYGNLFELQSSHASPAASSGAPLVPLPLLLLACVATGHQ